MKAGVALSVTVIVASIVLLLGASAAWGVAESPVGGSLPGLLTQLSTAHPFAVRPPVVGYTGDGSGWLGGFDGSGKNGTWGHLTWSIWTRSQAVGSGAVWLDNCQPDCARGRFAPFRVQVHALAPKSGHFTRLTLKYRYGGKIVVDRRGLQHHRATSFGPGYYEYYIIGYPP